MKTKTDIIVSSQTIINRIQVAMKRQRRATISIRENVNQMTSVCRPKSIRKIRPIQRQHRHHGVTKKNHPNPKHTGRQTMGSKLITRWELVLLMHSVRTPNHSFRVIEIFSNGQNIVFVLNCFFKVCCYPCQVRPSQTKCQCLHQVANQWERVLQ